MQSLGELVTEYSGLFSSSSDGVDGDSKWFVKRYGWRVTIDNLANGDILKYKHIYHLPVIEFLNILAFEKDKQKLERQQRDKMNKQGIK